MKISKLLVTACTVLFLLSIQTIHGADENATPGVDKREANQQRRIQQGVKSGELTPREAARLERGEKRIERMEEKAKTDGKVTAQKRKRLHRAENAESRKIYREKHDKQRRK